MKYELISTKIKKLDLNPSDLVVIGSGILQELGIRQSSDVDIAISETEKNRLMKNSGLKFKRSEQFQTEFLELTDQKIEIWTQWWDFKMNQKIDYQELVAHSVALNGIRFVRLDYLRNWKSRTRRAKDLQDIKLIDKFLAK